MQHRSTRLLAHIYYPVAVCSTYILTCCSTEALVSTCPCIRDAQRAFITVAAYCCCSVCRGRRVAAYPICCSVLLLQRRMLTYADVCRRTTAATGMLTHADVCRRTNAQTLTRKAPLGVAASLRYSAELVEFSAMPPPSRALRVSICTLVRQHTSAYVRYSAQLFEELFEFAPRQRRGGAGHVQGRSSKLSLLFPYSDEGKQNVGYGISANSKPIHQR